MNSIELNQDALQFSPDSENTAVIARHIPDMPLPLFHGGMGAAFRPAMATR